MSEENRCRYPACTKTTRAHSTILRMRDGEIRTAYFCAAHRKDAIAQSRINSGLDPATGRPVKP